jgi:hypothetical protein
MRSKLWATVVAFVLLAGGLRAETDASGKIELLGKLSWATADLTPGTHLVTGPDGESILQISTEKGLLSLLTVPDEIVQKITRPAYAILGDVRCEKVETGCYLELHLDFVPTIPGQVEVHKVVQDIGAGGPMGSLIGTQDWREFWLPINTANEVLEAKVSRLRMNLRGTGPGTVYLRNLRLVQYIGPTQDFLIHQIEIYVHADWMGTQTYSTDNKTFTDLAPIKRLLETEQQTHPQDRVTILHPRSIGYAQLDPLTQLVKNAGFPPMYGETTDASPSGIVKWIVLALLLTLIAGGIAVYFFANRTRRHERELRRMASLDS